ncbi:hypothetical protein EGI22_04170 [Lacihabitans sp. LS3-19]|uniref:hypothetical protein n=1 Tax=Lacihabitans sp. LS3-19 TaxID=2487335 RepID=UPI0020CB8756|nr:hypothetical protein [Lacihabitans sp. LS3-19]MCP9767093.1 hypothetical protein [Lacihabitans sp. LS3-19]
MFESKSLSSFLDDSSDNEKKYLLKKFPQFKSNPSFFKYFYSELKKLQNSYSVSILQTVSFENLYFLIRHLFVIKNKSDFDTLEAKNSENILFNIFEKKIWPLIVEKDIIENEILEKIKSFVWKSFLSFVSKNDSASHILLEYGGLSINFRKIQLYYESQMIVYAIRVKDQTKITLTLNKYLQIFNQRLKSCYSLNRINTLLPEDKEDIIQDKTEKLIKKIREDDFELTCTIGTLINKFLMVGVSEFFKKTNYNHVELEDWKLNYFETKLSDESLDYELYTKYLADTCLKLNTKEQTILKGSLEKDLPNEVMRRFLKLSNVNMKTIKSRTFQKIRLYEKI